ncbi:MAG: hypothetical protein K6F63_03295 [Lachnospiraceae bacterium]|nr:hypothetical protein [Lachnospiraceae bacterium]
MEDTKEQLVQIMELYNIGKKPLSKLLGWGETTVINQLKGALPSREFAEKINEIWENPYLFSEILEKNRDKITEVAYKKARRALDEKLLKDKASNIILYLVALVNGDTAPYQLVATLFYSQAASLILYGKPLIDEDIVYKPRNYMPYPEIYFALLRKGLHMVTASFSGLSPEDSNLVSQVHKLLNGYSPNAVKALLKDDRNALLLRHKGEREAQDAETAEGIQISLSEFQAYCVNENLDVKAADIKGFRKYFDEKLKKSKNRSKTKA